MTTTVLIEIGLGAVALVAIVYIVLQRRSTPDSVLLHQRLDSLNTGLLQQMQSMQTLMQQQLQENRTTLTETHQHIGTRLDHAAQVVGKVQERLAQMDEGNKRILEVGKDIASLQDILRAPKLRGSLGELFLGTILEQTLPKDHYAMQHMFKSGEKVDAVIKLRDGYLVPVDAKFPLENFRRYLSTDDEAAREVMRKTFRGDVKKHVDAIAERYILQAEGTSDFALMYIPAENVYYEIIVKDETEGALLNYAFQKKVIPVSPNSFYVYLQAIMLGLRGMKIEEEASSILKHLQMLNTEFGKFAKDYGVLGSHLGNAQSKYADTERQLGKIGLQLESIDSHTEALPAAVDENEIK